ncbi:MAG: hemerythrin domain-containing protein [Rhizobacter sp.]|nr:hemerythrin domain-containing protein [Rhizobacter sp.]
MNAPRYDIYAFIHKGLRAFMAHTLLRVGRLDPHDEAEVAEASAEVDALLDICRGHVHHENDVIHAAMEARQPGSTQHIAGDHAEHERAIDEMRELTATLRGSDGAAQALYRALGAFVSHNLAHMAQEESEHNAVLWATHSDEEIAALEQRIHASIGPDEMALAMRWMLPHMNPAERAAMLRGMRREAPPEVFAGVLGLVQPLLGGRDWLKLHQALAL